MLYSNAAEFPSISVITLAPTLTLTAPSAIGAISKVNTGLPDELKLLLVPFITTISSIIKSVTGLTPPKVIVTEKDEFFVGLGSKLEIITVNCE
jgi:hypothetical protein